MLGSPYDDVLDCNGVFSRFLKSNRLVLLSGTWWVIGARDTRYEPHSNIFLFDVSKRPVSPPPV